MIALALAWLRNSLGFGKSELGMIIHFLVVAAYLAPAFPKLDWDLMVNIQMVVGAFTFSGFVGRIENMKTVLKALRSIFLQWGKKK